MSNEEPPAGEGEEPEVLPPSTADLAFSTKKFALQAALERTAAVLPTRDVSAVLKNFQIEASVENGGTLRIIATDMDLSIISILQMVTVERPGTAVFPGKRLLEIVKEADDSELVVDVKDGEAHIRVGRAEWTLKLEDGSTYPAIPDAENVEMTDIDRGKLYQAITGVSLAAARDNVRPHLMVVNISANRVRAADGVRFQQVTLKDCTLPDMDIPIAATDDLLKLLKTTDQTTIRVGLTEDHLIFAIAGDTFIAARPSEPFPEMDDILLKPAMGNDQKLSADREALLRAIRKARITADPETNGVILELSTNSIIARCKDKFGNTGLEPVDASWTPNGEDPRLVAVNHVHLSQMLQMSDAKSVEMFLGTDTRNRRSPLLMRDDESQTIGLVTQLRIDWIS